MNTVELSESSSTLNVENQKKTKPSHWRRAAIIFVVVAGMILSFLWFIGVLTSNFRIVTPGTFYRSGQMDAEDLRRTVNTWHIRTLVNLRGSNKGSWYAEEKKTARELNLHFVDIQNFDANRLPPPTALTDLLQTFHTEPYPMLVHCKAGSDRTGLACVLYRVIIEKVPFDSALKEQLSWQYGHFPVGEVQAMDDFFNLYIQKGRGKPLEQWIREDYPNLYQRWLLDRIK